MSTFQDRMDEAISLCDGNQSELARRVRVRFKVRCSPQTIQYLANRKKKPKPAGGSRLSAQIAAVVGLNAEWLASGRGPKFAPNGVASAGTKSVQVPEVAIEPTFAIVFSPTEEITEVELTRSAIEWARAWMELSGRHKQELKQLITRYALEDGSYVPDEMLHHLAAPNSEIAKAAKKSSKQRTRKPISG